MASTVNFSWSSLFCFIFSLHPACCTHMMNCPIDAVYQFGDSLSDTGNSIRLGPYLPANRLPYGKTFPGHPTGRWSDGRLIIDVMAEALGLELLDPYLQRLSPFKNGVNFAVAGATALDQSTLSSKGISSPQAVDLGVQISWFMAWLRQSCSTQSECSNKLNNSMILFGEIGGNDMNYAMSQNKSIEELRALVPFLTQAIIRGIEDVIESGASKFMVPGNFPVGCIPFAMNSFSGKKLSDEVDEFGCLKSANELATYQNRHLQSALAALSRKHPGVVVMYMDYYNAFMHLLRQASTLGFNGSMLLNYCCGGGDYDFGSRKFCGGGDAVVCDNPNQYVHWDGVHLTQAAYAHMFNFLASDIASTFQCTL